MALLQPGTSLSRYTILGRLAIGGMSEIYLARHTGPSGFSKILVIKVILPHLSDDPSFMKMFSNEARLAALLNHANVVQIFDFGAEENEHYIAMEYIDGQNLRRIQKRLQRLGQQGSGLPTSIALRVVADTSGALEYAHGLTDPSGEHLGMIHRDISLDNILLTYSGQVKLVDFGIAKAPFLDSSTAQGTLKGRYHYMAPELIRGEKIDHRVDIYSLGVVAYTLLVGKLPYAADNLRALFNTILHSEPRRPTEGNPELPKELEPIILKAMHKDQSQRYQRAGVLQAELEGYLEQNGLSVTPFHLARFMEQTFPPGTDPDRETYSKLVGTSPHQVAPTDVDLDLPKIKPVTTEVDLDLPKTKPTTTEEPEPTPPTADRRSRRPLLMAAVLVLSGAALVTLYLLLAEESEKEKKIALTLDIAAGPTSSDAKDLPLPRSPQRRDSGASMHLHDLKPAPQPVSVDAQATPAARRTVAAAFLSIRASLPGQASLDGRRLGALPVTRARVRPGRHKLMVRNAQHGYQISRTLHLKSGEHERVQLTPGKGTLRIMARPWAQVMLDGKVLGSTPIRPLAVYEGRHVLTFVNSKLKAKKQRTIQVQPGQEVLVKVRMDR